MAAKHGLLLVGIGMGDIHSMTTSALNAVQNADLRILESYTAKWNDDDILKLKETVGEFEYALRPDIENPDKILAQCQEKSVAIMVIGDPMQATTHVDLLLRAEELEIPYNVYHGISITNLATGISGLSNYRFGRPTTLTYAYGGWVATSPLEVISVNLQLNLHTLVLFDLDPTGLGTGNMQPMLPIDARKVMYQMLEKWQEDSLQEIEEVVDSSFNFKQHSMKKLPENLSQLPVVVCTDLGTTNQSLWRGILGSIEKAPVGNMHCMIIPSRLSEIEEKALNKWAKE